MSTVVYKWVAYIKRNTETNPVYFNGFIASLVDWKITICICFKNIFILDIVILIAYSEEKAIRQAKNIYPNKAICFNNSL